MPFVISRLNKKFPRCITNKTGLANSVYNAQKVDTETVDTFGLLNIPSSAFEKSCLSVIDGPS